MVNYATELEIKGKVYLLKDTEAREELKNKARLINGKIDPIQLPDSAWEGESVVAALQSKLDASVFNTQWATLSPVAISGQFSDLGGIEAVATQDNIKKFVDESLGDYAKVVEVDEKLTNYATIAFVSEKFEAATENKITSYTQLTDKPKINGVELTGDISSEDLGINAIIQETDPIYTADKENLATKSWVTAEILKMGIVGVTKKGPVQINFNEANEYILDISKYPYAYISAVSIVKDDAEIFVPLFSTNGVSIISKQTKTIDGQDKLLIYLEFGPDTEVWETGYVYLGQFMDNSYIPTTPDSSDSVYAQEATLIMLDLNGDGNPQVDRGALIMTDDASYQYSVNSEGTLNIISK